MQPIPAVTMKVAKHRFAPSPSGRGLGGGSNRPMAAKLKLHACPCDNHLNLRMNSKISSVNAWLQSNGIDQAQGIELFGIGQGIEGKDLLDISEFTPTGVAHDHGEFIEQGTKAVGGRAVGQTC